MSATTTHRFSKRITRFLAGAMLAGSTVAFGAIASPASAEDAGDAPAAPTTVQPAETPEHQAAREAAWKEVDAAVNDAKYKVAEAACRDYLGTSASGLKPLDVLSKVMVDGRVRDLFDTPGPVTPPSTQPAIATGTTGKGENGTITLYKDFHSKTAGDADQKLFAPPLSYEKWQTLVIVHELAHLMGKTHPAGSDRAYEDALAKACLNSSKPPPPPPPTSGHHSGGDDAAMVPDVGTVVIIDEPADGGSGAATPPPPQNGDGDVTAAYTDDGVDIPYEPDGGGANPNAGEPDPTATADPGTPAGAPPVSRTPTVCG